MLQEFAPEVWLADGPVVQGAAGFHFPTRMVVIRLRSGDLFVWSPIALTEDLKRDIDALGPVSYLVAPNKLHHVFLSDWISAYPTSEVHAPPGLRKVDKHLRLDRFLGDTAPKCWADEIDQVVMRGNRICEEVVFFHKRSGTVIFADLLQQLPQGWFRGWRGVVARLDLMMTPAPSVPRKFRWAFKDRSSARNAVGRILDWPIERLVIAHGPPVELGAHQNVVRAFSWLAPRDKGQKALVTEEEGQSV